MKNSFLNFINVIIKPTRFFEVLTEITNEKFVFALLVLIEPFFYLINLNFFVSNINNEAEKFGLGIVINNQQALISIFFVFISNILVIIINAALVFSVIKLSLGDIKFKIAWKISVFSMAPFVIEKIFTIVISAIKKTMYLQVSPFSILGYVKGTNFFENATLQCLNVFNVIFLVFLVIGLRKQKIGVGKIIAVSVIIGSLYFLYICLNEFSKEGLL